jgi:hypothetical protein
LSCVEIQGFFSAEDTYFGYFEREDVKTCQKALTDLQNYIAFEGPFDGVIAFSQGATVASTLIIHHARRNPSAAPIFKCAIFFSGGQPCDPDLLESGRVRMMNFKEDGEVIQVPTANIWGRNDPLPWVGELDRLCAVDRRITYIHNGSHEIPGSKMKDTVTDCVNVFRRIVNMAEKTV